MSPILVRPVREQLEHDRVIRLLQAKYKRKFEVAINPGQEQTASVLVGTSPWYPDLVLFSQERSRKLMGTVEVETAESVNNLEAMSQWKNFASLRAPFHLYVPTSAIDTARRMANELQIPVAEVWAYSAIGDQLRFTLVQRSAAAEKAERAEKAEKAEKAPRTAAAAEPRPARVPEPKAAAAARSANARPAAAAARAAKANGQGRGSRPTASSSASARPVRRAAAPAPAKARRKTAAPARSTKTAAPRRAAAKKTAARAKRK